MSNTTDPGSLPDPDDYNGQSVVPVAVLTVVLAGVLVGMRFYARIVILRKLCPEDWFILASLVFAIVNSVGMGLQLQFGLGKHVAYITPNDYTSYIKTGVLTSLAYALSLTLTKISILCLYIRVLTYEYLRLAAKFLLWIVVLAYLYTVATQFTACIPLEAFWDVSLRTPDTYCHPQALWWSHAGLNIVTDFLIFFLPLTVLHKLKVPRRQKVALYMVFTFAFVVCVISLVRVILMAQDFSSPNHDFTYDAVVSANLTIIEVNTAIICACLTTIKPLIVRLFPSLLRGTPAIAGDSPEIPALTLPGKSGRNGGGGAYLTRSSSESESKAASMQQLDEPKTAHVNERSCESSASEARSAAKNHSMV